MNKYCKHAAALGLIVLLASCNYGGGGQGYGIPGFLLDATITTSDPFLGQVVIPAWTVGVAGALYAPGSPTWGLSEYFSGYATWYDATYDVPDAKVPGYWRFAQTTGPCATSGYGSPAYAPANYPTMIANCNDAPSEGGAELQDWDTLYPDDSRTSVEQGFALVYQQDGNLVLYDAYSTALWASNTCCMQPPGWVTNEDGNLVVYDAYGDVMWASSSGGVSGAILLVRPDGDAVMYAPDDSVLWETGTHEFY